MFKFLSGIFWPNPSYHLSDDLMQILKQHPEEFISELENQPQYPKLIQSGEDKHQLSLLHIAVQSAHRHREDSSYPIYLEILIYLLNNNADVNKATSRGFTPFMFAIRLLLTDVIELFLETGRVDLSLRVEAKRFDTSNSSSYPANGRTARQMLDKYHDDSDPQRIPYLKELLDEYEKQQKSGHDHPRT